MDWITKLVELKITPRGSVEFAPLTSEEVAAIERTLKSPLPTPYRDFLMKYGASDFEEYAVFATEGGGVAPGRFFGRELSREIVGFAERLPPLFVPINDDGAGNLFCISLRTSEFGAVYYQSHSGGVDSSAELEGPSDPSRMTSLIWLARDFPTFIEQLVAD